MQQQTINNVEGLRQHILHKFKNQNILNISEMSDNLIQTVNILIDLATDVNQCMNIRMRAIEYLQKNLKMFCRNQNSEQNVEFINNFIDNLLFQFPNQKQLNGKYLQCFKFFFEAIKHQQIVFSRILDYTLLNIQDINAILFSAEALTNYYEFQIQLRPQFENFMLQFLSKIQVINIGHQLAVQQYLILSIFWKSIHFNASLKLLKKFNIFMRIIVYTLELYIPHFHQNLDKSMQYGSKQFFYFQCKQNAVKIIKRYYQKYLTRQQASHNRQYSQFIEQWCNNYSQRMNKAILQSIDLNMPHQIKHDSLKYIQAILRREQIEKLRPYMENLKYKWLVKIIKNFKEEQKHIRQNLGEYLNQQSNVSYLFDIRILAAECWVHLIKPQNLIKRRRSIKKQNLKKQSNLHTFKNEMKFINSLLQDSDWENNLVAIYILKEDANFQNDFHEKVYNMLNSKHYLVRAEACKYFANKKFQNKLFIKIVQLFIDQNQQEYTKVMALKAISDLLTSTKNGTVSISKIPNINIQDIIRLSVNYTKYKSLQLYQSLPSLFENLLPLLKDKQQQCKIYAFINLCETLYKFTSQNQKIQDSQQYCGSLLETLRRIVKQMSSQSLQRITTSMLQISLLLDSACQIFIEGLVHLLSTFFKKYRKIKTDFFFILPLILNKYGKEFSGNYINKIIGQQKQKKLFEINQKFQLNDFLLILLSHYCSYFSQLFQSSDYYESILQQMFQFQYLAWKQQKSRYSNIPKLICLTYNYLPQSFIQFSKQMIYDVTDHQNKQNSILGIQLTLRLMYIFGQDFVYRLLNDNSYNLQIALALIIRRQNYLIRLNFHKKIILGLSRWLQIPKVNETLRRFEIALFRLLFRAVSEKCTQKQTESIAYPTPVGDINYQDLQIMENQQIDHEDYDYDSDEEIDIDEEISGGESLDQLYNDQQAEVQRCEKQLQYFLKQINQFGEKNPQRYQEFMTIQPNQNYQMRKIQSNIRKLVKK